MKILEFSKMDDIKLKKCLESYNIWLTNEEARKINKILDRDPTLVEAVIWWIQGSEHASYKSTRNFLKQLPTSWPNVILWPSEDSWIIKLCDLPDWDKYWIVLSHESHNSPSQIVPYEGAATWVWWIMRDIICMWSKAIWVLDSMRFWELSSEKSKLIAKWCIKWVAWYWNPIWVPNLGWDIYFDENFKDYCLVNVFATWLIKESQLIHSFAPDEAWKEKYDFIIIWKPTDESWFWWSSFASKTLDEEKEDENKWAVQEPNPFLERHIMAATYDLFKELEEKWELKKVWFKDMWAGWILCATVELVSPKNFWAEIDIEKIHTAYDWINPEVIACSETQERFAWICHPSLTQKILDHYNKKWALWEVSKWAWASHVWHATEDPFFKLSYKWELVCNAKSIDITEWLLYDRKWKVRDEKFEEPDLSSCHLEESEAICHLEGSEAICHLEGSEAICHLEGSEATKDPSKPYWINNCSKNIENLDSSTGSEWQKINMKLGLKSNFLNLISSPNCASTSCVYENYDKSVQWNTIIERSEAKASVIQPLTDEKWISDKIKNIWVAYSQTWNWRYWLISSYEQSANAIASAMLQVASVWAVPQTITDCLNYWNPENEIQMWDFVEWIRWIKEACHWIKLKWENCATPIISWNVSMYKQVPTSAIIGCMWIISDWKKAITKKLKSDNSSLILIWKRKNELWGSEFYRILNNGCHPEGSEATKDPGKSHWINNYLEEIKNLDSSTGSEWQNTSLKWQSASLEWQKIYWSNDKHWRLLWANIPKTNFAEVEKIIYTITDLIEDEKILSSNEIELWWIAKSITEMLMPNQKDWEYSIWAEINFWNSNLETYQELFSETLWILIEVKKENEKEILNAFWNLAEKIWETNNTSKLKIETWKKNNFEISNKEIFEKWSKGLREKLS